MTATRSGSRHFSIRIPIHLLEEIDRQAQARHLPRTTYILRAALGELEIDPAHERFNQLELRIMRLEHHVGLH